MSSVVCTLIDQWNGHRGGALINSLTQNGFRGLVWIGYRGPLPGWAQRADSHNSYSELSVGEGTQVRFVLLDRDGHASRNERAIFIRAVLDNLKPEDSLFYFDADIVIDIDWSFFDHWVKYGIALCADKNWNIPSDHPERRRWKAPLEQRGMKLRKPQTTFVSDGFIGVASENRAFIDHWLAVSGALNESTGNFQASSKQTLNAAIETAAVPFSLFGPDGMGYCAGHRIMCPTAKKTEPSQQRWEFASINAARIFWRYSQSPIKVSSAIEDSLQFADRAYGRITGRSRKARHSG